MKGDVLQDVRIDKREAQLWPARELAFAKSLPPHLQHTSKEA